MASVAGYGKEVGVGGGFVLLGQTFLLWWRDGGGTNGVVWVGFLGFVHCRELV